MATHSSILTWRIPWTEEPGRPWSVGSQRVGHDCSDWSSRGLPHSSVGKESACNAGDPDLIRVRKIPWRRGKLPTPVFLPGEFHGVYSPQGCKESDTAERPSLSISYRVAMEKL